VVLFWVWQGCCLVLRREAVGSVLAGVLLVSGVRFAF